MYYLERHELKHKDYTECVKKIASFDTVEEFWSIYSYLSRIDELKDFEFMLFRRSILPRWEHTENQNGGKWQIKIDKEYANQIWELCLLGFIGSILDLSSQSNYDQINGITISTQSKLNYIIISIWNKNKKHSNSSLIRERLEKVLRIDINDIDLEYKVHNSNYKR